MVHSEFRLGLERHAEAEVKASPTKGRRGCLTECVGSSCDFQMIVCRPVIVPASNRGEMCAANLPRQGPGMFDWNNRIIDCSENLNGSGIVAQCFHVIPGVAKH